MEVFLFACNMTVGDPKDHFKAHQSDSQFSHSAVSNSVTPWTAAHQSSLSITNSWRLLKLMSIKLVMPSNHFIFCHLLLLPVFNLSQQQGLFKWVSLRMRWPKYWRFSFSISPSMNIHNWFPLGCTGWISLLSKRLSRVFSNTTVQKHQFFGAQLSL